MQTHRLPEGKRCGASRIARRPGDDLRPQPACVHAAALQWSVSTIWWLGPVFPQGPNGGLRT